MFRWKHIIKHAAALSASGALLYNGYTNDEIRKHFGHTFLRSAVLKDTAQSYRNIDSSLKNIMAPKSAPYVLIGGGTASYYAALTIRARDPEAIVLIITDEAHSPYTRMPLSKELLWYGADDVADTLKYKGIKGRSREVFYEVDGFYIPPTDWDRFPHGCVSLLKESRVSRIDPDTKEIVLDNGQIVKYGKCLIATGCRTKVPNMFDVKGVRDRTHVIKNIEDFQNLISYGNSSKRIAVIGNGLLSSEISYSLIRRFGSRNGLKVTQIFEDSSVLQAFLPQTLSDDVAKQMFKHGVDLSESSKIEKVSANTDGSVRLRIRKADNSVRDIDVDHVIVEGESIPNIEFAARSGLEIDLVSIIPCVKNFQRNGGILTDSEMRVRSDLFAAGDVASFFEPKMGRRRLQQAENAEITGRVSGENMTGGRKTYPREPMFRSLAGTDAHFSGIGEISSGYKTIVVTAQKDQSVDDELKAVVFYVDADVIVGILLYNVFGDGVLMARKLIADQRSPENIRDLARLFRLYGTLDIEEKAEEKEQISVP